MCSLDRIENTTNSQLEFFRELQLSVNLSNHPACVRQRDGTFSHYNQPFSRVFLQNTNVNSWFQRLETSSSLRLSVLDSEVYSCEQKLLIEENLSINGEKWDFIIERMELDGVEFCLWKFCHLQRGVCFHSPVRANFMKKINTLKNAIDSLSDVQIETLALYSLGASHHVISDVLNVSEGTSKNRINRIYATLPIKSKEQIFYLIFAGGVAFSFFKVVNDIILRYVNRMLNK